MVDRRSQGGSEHDVELRESEDEPVVPIDQGDVNAIPKAFGQLGCHLHATEACAKHNNSHGRTLTEPECPNRFQAYLSW